jgi:diguanylate cyclase (GGDEF)-like protein
MAAFTTADANKLTECMHWLNVWFSNNLLAPVQGECSYIPEEIDRLSRQIKAASDHLASFSLKHDGVDLEDVHLSVYKQAVIVGRQRIAADIERRGEHVHHGPLKSSLQRELEPLDRLIGQEWFHITPSLVMPRLTSFLSLQRAEILLDRSEPEAALSPRVYDEKFHILQAPDLFQKDLHYFRKRCELRGNSVAAAFIDIDDFKKRFNKPHGNDRIDRDVLPRFMETLESHVFGRGFGYRQGGDEYLVLLPSVSFESAVSVLDELRQKLADLNYPGILERTTVSIGMCLVGPGCFLTDKEVRERATKASAHAKEPEKEKPKKNCIATYRGTRFRTEDLYVAAPT